MSRRKAREAALKALYRIDLVGGDAREALADLRVPDASRAYASFLVEGVLAHLAELDAEISAHLIDWTIDRLSPVDRAILRIGTFELLYAPDVPARVSLDEAIELAKRYSDDRAPAFINGVLASVYRERRMPEAPSAGPEGTPDSGSEPEEEGRR
ncbi:MAG: Transcription termination protein NusB [Brockia lithotrophica]|uniref:Transcription antitermination protein NusB n=1 Tax=Brockia lithotrophica TaxID=933949 RepID=A0A2T5G664_9BACL|nr:transcription antitermination factor NusB [Brockia lithotrophica]MBT9252377.1 transcription antitermination factor NusB [Brockia lithotrophica]PTQ51681.1 MAG: Transcription termination protein NusB [Brockia lithotrophica]